MPFVSQAPVAISIDSVARSGCSCSTANTLSDGFDEISLDTWSSEEEEPILHGRNPGMYCPQMAYLLYRNKTGKINGGAHSEKDFNIKDEVNIFLVMSYA